MIAENELRNLFPVDSADYKLLSMAFRANCHEYFISNLTKDKIEGDIHYFDHEKLKTLDSYQSLSKPFRFSEFHKWRAENMVVSNTSEYLKKNSLEYMINAFKYGEKTIAFHYKTQLFDGSIDTVRQVSFLMPNEKNSDLMCFTLLTLTGENQEIESHSLYSKPLIQSLVADFEAVFFVNLKTDSVFTLRTSTDFFSKNSKIQESVIYSEFCKNLVESYVLPEDSKATLNALSSKNIFREFNQKDLFTVNYRIKNKEGEIEYFQFKLVKTNEWDSKNSFILGIHNVDEETLKNFEQLEKIRLQAELNLQLSSVIQAISRDFTSVFYIEFDKNRVFEYRTSEYFRQFQPATSEPYISLEHFEEILTRVCQEKIFPEYQDQVLYMISPKNIRKVLMENPVYYYTFKMRYLEAEKYYQLKLVRDLTKKDEFCIVAGFIDIDIQQRKEILQQKTLEEARIKAEVANKAKSTFLFNMSHDIRTPMNAIIGYTAMAERYIDNPQKALESLEKVKLSGDHLLHLIDDILDMARIENGKVTIDNNPTKIRDCIEKIVEIESVDAKNANLDFEVVFENIKTEFVIADAFRLNQIFLNIIGNSIKYTKAGGKVTLVIRELPCQKAEFATFEFSVIDNGIGMSQEFLAHIFDMFSRERNSTDSKVQGTGLGMAIVKNLVDLMGGTIAIESELGKGTKVTFKFDFKIQKNPKVLKEKSLNKKSKNFSLKGKRVMLVEDNELNREIAKDILETQNLIVEEAADGSEAIEKLKSSKPGFYNFILMDIQMPIIDGYKATTIIRKLDNKKLAETPIIAMTANAFDEDKKRALDCGMNAYLSKPINPEILFDTLSGVLSKK